MTSHFRREDERLMFTPKSPHFFKIILEEAIPHGRLGIPRKFVEKYGNGMPSLALLEVPSGAVWQVELSKSDGRIWLQNGWQEFAEYYSLRKGHFLVFRYEKNNGHFHVLIFDMSASEIEYPFTKLAADEDFDSDGAFQGLIDVEDSEDDVSLEIIEDIAPCKKRREKSTIQCPRPHKMMKTNNMRTYGTRARGIQLEKTKEHRSSDCSKRGFSGGLKPSKGTRRRMDNEWECPEQAEISGFRQLTAEEKARTLQIANAFKSENPSFLVVMQRSHISGIFQMCIPLKFARRYLMEKLPLDEAILCLSDGKTLSVNWSVKCYLSFCKGNPRAQVGWREFAVDNNLKVGDVCVLELLKGTQILLKVVIHRIAEEISIHQSEGVADKRRACSVNCNDIESDLSS